MCGMNELLTVGTIAYDKRNEAVGDGYGYASDEAITTAFRKVMHESGLHVKSFEIVSSEMGEVETRVGTCTTCMVVVRFFFSDGTNDYGPFEGIGMGMDRGDKSPMKALTAARKYAISQAALISWGDDPEGDMTTDTLADMRTPKENGKEGEPKPKLKLVLDKPEGADLFMSLLTEKAKVSLDALQDAWAWDSQDQEVARNCRRYVDALHDGKWWADLKAKASKKK